MLLQGLSELCLHCLHKEEIAEEVEVLLVPIINTSIAPVFLCTKIVFIHQNVSFKKSTLLDIEKIKTIGEKNGKLQVQLDRANTTVFKRC